jgi:O-antigen/teichoic acid export membrane protein
VCSVFSVAKESQCGCGAMASETTTKAPSLASQVSRAVLWNTLFVPLRMLAELLATLVKLTLLTPAQYGLLALVSGAGNGLGTTVDLGTARALPKYIPETNNTGGPRATLRLLLAVLGAQLVAFLALAAGLLLLHGAYLDGLRAKIRGDARLSPASQADLLQFVQNYGWLLIGVILLVLFLSGIGYDMLMAYLTSFFKQRAWNSITLAAGLLPPLLSAGAILAGWGLVGVLVAMAMAPAIAVLLAGWQVARAWGGTSAPFHRSTVPTFQRSRLPRGFVRYSGVSYLMTMTDYLASASFAVFLARDIVDAALLWAGANVVRMALAYLYTPMVGVQVPLFTRVRAGEGGTLRGAYSSLIRLQVLLMVPGGIGLMLLAQPVIMIISRPEYAAATPIVWVLVPCLFLESLLTTAHNALIVYEHLRIIVISRLLTLLVIVPLALTLPPLLGLVGVALAFGLARLAAGFWVTASGYRLLGLRWPWRFTLRVLPASGVMALLVVGMRLLLPDLTVDATIVDRLGAALLLLLPAALGGTGFLGVLRLTGGLEPQDREQLLRLKLPLKRWWLRVL